jgi:hypothetical protein
MKYPQYVIDYAIDNKISLEEAHNHFIMNGKEEEKEPKIEINIEEEEQFLSDLEKDILKQSQSSDDEQWWMEWKAKMKKIEKMEQELNIENSIEEDISKEEYEWVEEELKQCDKLYEEMFGKDV